MSSNLLNLLVHFSAPAAMAINSDLNILTGSFWISIFSRACGTCLLYFCFRHSKRLFQQVCRAGETVFLGNRLLDRPRIISIDRFASTSSSEGLSGIAPEPGSS
jgi:hypothetical protein